jgi:hypothetical protein
MCNAFSCIVGSDKKVTWKLGVDSHTELLKKTTHKDNTYSPMEITFARVEITPNNGNYLNPDGWSLKIDQAITPAWWNNSYDALAWRAKDQWQAELDKILVHKPIIHPFKDVQPPNEITPIHISLLRDWDSVRDSVGDSVRDSVRDSVGASVGNSVGDSVRDSVRASVGDSVRASVGNSVWDSVGDSVRDSVWASVGASVGNSVWASVGAYTGSFFTLPTWKYIKHEPNQYPFIPCVKLWESGLVPSFDGKTWRLHGGPKGEVLFSITKAGLKLAIAMLRVSERVKK